MESFSQIDQVLDQIERVQCTVGCVQRLVGVTSRCAFLVRLVNKTGLISSLIHHPHCLKLNIWLSHPVEVVHQVTEAE